MATRYWITDSGVWEDTASWSTSSGGAGGASVPVAGDTVIFDTGSFPYIGFGYVEVYSAVDCYIDNSASAPFGFEIGSGGIFSLHGELNIGEFNLYGTGVLNTNNYDIITNYVSFSDTCVGNLGTSVITAGAAAGNVFYGAGIGFVSISINGGTFVFSYDIEAINTIFTDNTVTGSGTFTAPSNKGNIDAGGNIGWDFSSSILPFIIYQASGTVNIENVTLYDSHATGGATFNAPTSNDNIDGWGNEGWNFSGEPVATYSLSGKVKGAIIEGVTISLTGSATDTTTTDSNGDYSFSGLYAGNYTVTPSYTTSPAILYIFTPTSLDVTIVNVNSIKNNFIDAPVMVGIGIASLTSPMLISSSQQALAISFNDDGTQSVITTLATWTSSNPTVATIDSSGVVVALAVGITFIKATYNGFVASIMIKVDQLTNTALIGSDINLQQIPLTPDPNQSFSSSLTVDGKNIDLDFRLRWNGQAGYWAMTLINPQTGDYLVDSIPLYAGVQPVVNLLQPYGYLGIGSCYIVNISNLPSEYPTDTNLGTDFIMLWGDTE